MLDNGCCDNSGGRLTVTIDGIRYSSRGGAELSPVAIDTQVGANDDGTIYTTRKAVPATARFTLTDKCGLDVTKIAKGCKVDVTFDQLDMRRKWLYTAATVIGRPTINTETGAISGFEIASSYVNVIPY